MGCVVVDDDDGDGEWTPLMNQGVPKALAWMYLTRVCVCVCVLYDDEIFIFGRPPPLSSLSLSLSLTNYAYEYELVNNFLT